MTAGGAAVPNVLTIAGSDPSGGAGIQADLKTFAALGAYGCAVVTALTAQNTLRVSSVHTVAPEVVREQLLSVFADVRVDAVKIGMLGNAGVARIVAQAIRTYRPPFVVIDPVVASSTGARLADDDTLAVIRDELLPLATVITPNAAEAGALARMPAPASVAGATSVAGALAGRGARAVLVTGGHLDDEACSVDLLVEGGAARELRVPRVPGGGAHGTGCTLSSAIAVFLARGFGLPEACAAAQSFVADAIAHAARLSVGRGVTPVHQLGALWEAADAAGPDADTRPRSER